MGRWVQPWHKTMDTSKHIDYCKSSHYHDVIITTIASEVTSLTVVYSTVYSDVDQRKHQSSASLAFVWGIHRGRWIPRTKGQLRGKCFHLMTSSSISGEHHISGRQPAMVLAPMKYGLVIWHVRRLATTCHPAPIITGVSMPAIIVKMWDWIACQVIDI